MKRMTSRGTVRKSADRLILTSNYGDWGPGHSTDTKEFVVVPWGERLYLIESNRVVEFCNAINAGDEPRTESHRPFLLRENDWKKEVKGFPAIPKPWQDKFLVKTPVTCSATKVGEFSKNVVVPEYPYHDGTLNGVRSSMNAGKEHGLAPGMKLHLQEEYSSTVAHVLSVEANTSEVLIQDIDRSTEALRAGLESGWRFSTRRMPIPPPRSR